MASAVIALVLALPAVAHAGPSCFPAGLSFAARLAKLRELNGPDYGAGYEESAEGVWNIEQLIRERLPDAGGAPDYAKLSAWLRAEGDAEWKAGRRERATQLVDVAGALLTLKGGDGDLVPLARALRQTEREHGDLRQEVEKAIEDINSKTATPEAVQLVTDRLHARLDKLGATWGSLADWCARESARIAQDDRAESKRFAIWAGVIREISDGRGTPASRAEAFRAWKLDPRQMETDLDRILELKEWRSAQFLALLARHPWDARTSPVTFAQYLTGLGLDARMIPRAVTEHAVRDAMDSSGADVPTAAARLGFPEAWVRARLGLPEAPPEPTVDSGDEEWLALLPEYRASKGDADHVIPPVSNVWETDPAAEAFYQKLAKTLDRDKNPYAFALRVDRLIHNLLEAGPEDRRVIRLAMTLSRRNSLERPFPNARGDGEAGPAPSLRGPKPAAEPGPVPTWEAREVEEVRRALWQSGGNQSEAARLLGITRNPLLDKLKRYQPQLQDLGKGPEASHPRPVRTLEEVYRDAIVEAFVAARGNRSLAADWLSLDRSTVTGILNGTARGKYAIEVAKPPVELPEGFQTLEARERLEVLKALAQGQNYGAAARLLDIATGTFKSRMSHYQITDQEAEEYRRTHDEIVVKSLRGMSYDAVQEALRLTNGVKTRAAAILGIDVQRIDTILRWGPQP